MRKRRCSERSSAFFSYEAALPVWRRYSVFSSRRSTACPSNNWLALVGRMLGRPSGPRVPSMTRMSLYFLPESAARPALSRTTVGRRKTIRLRLVWVSLVERNRRPSNGMSPSRGTFDSAWETSSWIRPPITITWPFSARMVLLIERLLVIRSVLLRCWALGSRAEISCSISRRRAAPSLMCGVTLRLTPISLRSTVVNGLLEPSLLVV